MIRGIHEEAGGASAQVEVEREVEQAGDGTWRHSAYVNMLFGQVAQGGRVARKECYQMVTNNYQLYESQFEGIQT